MAYIEYRTLSDGVKMPKVAKNKKLVKKEATMLDNLPKNHGEYLELLIKMTEKRLENNNYDNTMKNQAVRLKSELAKWKRNQGKW